ncbi:CHAT domain-containing protein [Xylaria longipes]|nr:CHAT domain-containing protein [Xylaria longipes]
MTLGTNNSNSYSEWIPTLLVSHSIVTPLDGDYRAGYFATLGTRLRARYGKTGEKSDLEEAICLTQAAFGGSTEDEWDHRRFSKQLQVLHCDTSLGVGLTSDLQEKAIEITRAAVMTTPEDAPVQMEILNSFMAHLSDLCLIMDTVNFGERVVGATRAAFNITPTHHPARLPISKHLADSLVENFEQTWDIDALNEAILVLNAAINAAPDGHRDLETMLSTLRSCLIDRYTETGELADFEDAINILKSTIHIDANNDKAQSGTFSTFDALGSLEEAITFSRRSNLNKAPILNTLGHLLNTRFASTNSITDIHEAIQVTQEVVNGTIAHLEEAIRVQRAAVVRAENDDRERSGYLQLLGYSLYLRYSEIEVDAPEDSPHKAIYLTKISVCLAARHERTGARTDLNEAVRVAHLALAAAPKGSPNRARYLKHIALYLRDRYEKTRQMIRLNEAIQAAEEAVDATPNDHPDFAEVMGTLGTVLEERYLRTRATPDLQRAILCHQSALGQANAQVRTRIEADWQQAYEAILIVADLAPTLSLRITALIGQHVLSWAAGLASDAAAAALNAAKEPYAALDLLEQGRGLLATSLEEMRTDILSLREKHPDLAEKFVRLQGELNLQASRNETPLPHSRPSAHLPLRVRTSQPYQIDKEFDQLLVNIRSQPDFATFLLPRSREEMMQAAVNGGPIIVINVSKYRSDAILVERDQIRTVPLPRLRSHDVGNKTLSGEIGAPHTLVWLWDVIAKPVLDALGYTSRPSRGWPRVWWIPTGPLSRFPLHAAGSHEQGPGEAVIDRVMSSYSSSIKALIRGRQRPLRSELAPSIPPCALLVAMQNTPGQAPLRFANAEVEVLRDICKAIPADFVDPGQLRDDIVAQLPGCSIFHFAGHGCTNSMDPSQSHLLAYDGKITVAALLEMNLREHSPFLAHLSACGTGRVRDDAFLDEYPSHQRMSAGGFSSRHRDRDMTDDSVCLGLHNAARELRNRWLMGEMEENYREDQHVPATSNARQIAVRSEGQSRFPRDILPFEVKDPPWIPYVHFGV